MKNSQVLIGTVCATLLIYGFVRLIKAGYKTKHKQRLNSEFVVMNNHYDISVFSGNMEGIVDSIYEERKKTSDGVGMEFTMPGMEFTKGLPMGRGITLSDDSEYEKFLNILVRLENDLLIFSASDLAEESINPEAFNPLGRGPIQNGIVLQDTTQIGTWTSTSFRGEPFSINYKKMNGDSLELKFKIHVPREEIEKYQDAY